MDLISAVGLVQSSISLALQFGSAAKTLHDIADKYKNAKLAIKSLAQNLDILQLAWTQIGDWIQAEDGLHDDSLTKRVEGFLETGTLVIEALQQDVQAYNFGDICFSQRTRFVWNENSLHAHQSRLRDQALSMSLFLQAVNLPTPQARAKLLHESESQFQKSDESACSIDSIVPSRMSVSTGRTNSNISDQGNDAIQYRRLSFEKGLFMSRVYIRSSMNVMAKELSKARLGSKRKVGITIADQTVNNWEAIRDQIEADSLLATSCEVSINDTDTIKSHTNPESMPRFSEDTVRNRIDGDSLLTRSCDAFFNDNNTTEELIAPNVSGAIIDNELIRSCEQGDSLQVKWLATRGVDLHAQFKQCSYSGFTAIHVAAAHGHVDVAKILLCCGADIEVETASKRRRPLHLAARNGHVSMAKFLIREGAQSDAKACHGTQPIHDASWSDSVEILDALTEAGAAIDCLDRFGHQPLHLAAATPNHSNIIMYLIRKGADIEATASDGSNPLQLACTSDPTNFRTLIALRARMYYDDGRESVLETAIKCSSKWALEILLGHGADPNCQNRQGKTLLHTLAQSGCDSLRENSNDISMCRLLLDHGVDVHLKDEDGNQVLHFLATQKSGNFATTQRLAKLLLDQGAAVNVTNKRGLSPLYLAIYYRNRQFSRLLLESGSRILTNFDSFLADVQTQWIPNSPTPLYILRIRRSDIDFEDLEEMSAYNFELSLDDHGYLTESAMDRVRANMSCDDAPSPSSVSP